MTVNLAEKGASIWPSSVGEEFEANQFNGHVGTRLLSEKDRVRVWEIRLAPSEASDFIGTSWTISGLPSRPVERDRTGRMDPL
jgi:hypothetical protein